MLFKIEQSNSAKEETKYVSYVKNISSATYNRFLYKQEVLQTSLVIETSANILYKSNWSPENISYS